MASVRHSGWLPQDNACARTKVDRRVSLLCNSGIEIWAACATELLCNDGVLLFGGGVLMVRSGEGSCEVGEVRAVL